MLAKEIPSSNPDPQNPKSQVGLSQSPFHPLVHLSLSQFAPNFFWSYFFLNSKSSKQPQVAFGLGVAFLVTQQLPWAFSLLGALVIDGLCSVLKKVINEPRPPGSYREGPGMPSHLADRKAVNVPPKKAQCSKMRGKIWLKYIELQYL